MSRQSVATPENSTGLPETIEVQTGSDPTGTVIWMHGLGADGHDFEPMVPELVQRGERPLRFVFPNAPVRPVTHTVCTEEVAHIATWLRKVL